MAQPREPDAVTRLRRGDPPTIGDAVLVGRLAVSDAGIVYAAQLSGRSVAVALLTAGAETDSFARARFLDAVQESADTGGLSGSAAPLASGDEPDLAPWATVPAPSWADGRAAAEALLGPVTLRGLIPVGTVSGPGYRPHWAGRSGPGRWRAWPLPWPSAFSMAGRWTYVASFALVVAIASIALFIAVKLFDDLPPAPVPPPFPSPTSPSPTTGPSSPTTTSPSSPAPGSGGPRTTVTDVPPIV